MLRRVVVLETLVPLLLVAAVSTGLGFLAAELYLTTQLRYTLRPPGPEYYVIAAAGIAAAIGVVLATGCAATGLGRAALGVQEALWRGGHVRAVGFPDLLIAAVAEREHVAVLHYDSDYEYIAAVTGQPMSWVVPRGTVT